MAIEDEIAIELKTIETNAANELKVEIDDVKEVVAKVEAVIEPAKTVVAIPVLDAVQASAQPDAAAQVLVATSQAPATASEVDAILKKVKDLFTLADRQVVSFDVFAALAKKAVANEVDPVLVKLKSVMEYGGIKTDVWDEVVAVAKAL